MTKARTADFLLAGGKEFKVTLTAMAGNRRSEAVQPVYAYSFKQSSLNSASSLMGYRKALQEMLAAYPANRDPTIAWTPAHWNNLFRTLELGKGYYLLHQQSPL